MPERSLRILTAGLDERLVVSFAGLAKQVLKFPSHFAIAHRSVLVIVSAEIVQIGLLSFEHRVQHRLGPPDTVNDGVDQERL